MAYKDKNEYLAYQAKYRTENKKSAAEYNIAYYQSNKEKIIAYTASYRVANKEKIATDKLVYERKRRKTDPAYKFIKDLRRRHNHVLKGKVSTTFGLDCTSQELVEHLSSQFTEGMTLENHGFGKGKWNIDHIFPLSSFEEDENGNWDSNSEYNKLLIHFTNLQPLWHEDNLEKSNKVL